MYYKVNYPATPVNNFARLKRFYSVKYNIIRYNCTVAYAGFFQLGYHNIYS